jgi:hypothetical protein
MYVCISLKNTSWNLYSLSLLVRECCAVCACLLEACISWLWLLLSMSIICVLLLISVFAETDTIHIVLTFWCVSFLLRVSCSLFCWSMFPVPFVCCPCCFLSFVNVFLAYFLYILASMLQACSVLAVFVCSFFLRKVLSIIVLFWVYIMDWIVARCLLASLVMCSGVLLFMCVSSSSPVCKLICCPYVFS